MNAHRSGPCGSETCTCGCCEGTQVLTPLPIYNRPGLAALSYRVGRHGEFLESMKARLHRLSLETITGYDGAGEPVLARSYPLQTLTTRDSRDFSIALLDAWATASDVLSFYGERIANEGYLRTATERRSVLELARLVGYAPRPSVASTVYLAYTLDEGQSAPIPKGSRAQSVPGPGELPQSFETAEDLQAHAELNALEPRLTRPQHLTLADVTAPNKPVYLKGLVSTLKTGDYLLFHFDQEAFCRVREVLLEPQLQRTTVVVEPLDPPAPNVRALAERYIAKNPSESKTAEKTVDLLRTLRTVTSEDATREALGKLRNLRDMPSTRSSPILAAWLGDIVGDLGRALTPSQPARMDVSAVRPGDRADFELGELVKGLLKPASVPPANASRLGRDVSKLYDEGSDLIPKLYGALHPQLGGLAYRALARVAAKTPASLKGLEAMRVKAALFGHNAPPKITLTRTPEPSGELSTGNEIITQKEEHAKLPEAWSDLRSGENEALPLNVIALDGEYEGIKPDSWLVIERPRLAGDDEPDTAGKVFRYLQVQSVTSQTLSVFSFSAKVTVLVLRANWLPGESVPEPRASLTQTRVYAAGEPLALGEEPITGDICAAGEEGNFIELGGLYRGLEPGHWAIIHGERTDAEIAQAQGKKAGASTGVLGAELLMIAEVKHGLATVGGGFATADNTETALPGDTLHTFVRFAQPPRYCYKRDTVAIYGNVVKATHGETKTEVLGAGDAREAFQTFALKQPPLTYLAAPTPEGAESTLEVFVNDVAWQEGKHFPGLSKTDRSYIIRIDDDGKTSVVFGDGETGVRLPTGLENVRARYRSGIGAAGNVSARQISLLASRPLGVKEVSNPLPATGGADRESRDLARKNAPRAVKALDRLVSVQDYADFARAFAGIGKASAVELSDGKQQLVLVTVAGVDDAPIAKSSDLYRNLFKALRDLGDPYYPLRLERRELKLLVVKARVRLLPEYRWETVEPELRAGMLDAFGFERRELGQDVLQAEVLSTLQSTCRVAYIDLEVFGALGEEELSGGNPLEALVPKPGEGPKPRIAVNLARFDPVRNELVPAQLAFLSPAVPDTLILEPI